MPTEALIEQLKALADRSRLRVIAVCRGGEASVMEITAVLGQSQPRVSQHVKQLCLAGLLQRFRDGHRVYYRLPLEQSASLRQLLALIPLEDPQFVRDAERLQALRGEALAPARKLGAARRAFHRVLLEQTVAASLGDLLDIGCGRGDVLKLLAGRANRAVGVDIDANARLTARAELLHAGLANCSLRKGDMHGLPFDDASFDTIVMDDVLRLTERPLAALAEARRLLRAGGRLFLIVNTKANACATDKDALIAWCAEAGLRVGNPRPIPARDPEWLLAIASAGADRVTAAA